jgi:hypothetical protein
MREGSRTGFRPNRTRSQRVQSNSVTSLNKQGIELRESRCANEQATDERASAKAVALTNKQRTSALARKPLR